ncbi:MAG TPA: hypothetical protein VGQ58_01260 [Candidatus Limnocylindrales bacterium]|jgi:hypothetical protein|nr:hypothetical protein [Candidatus Limnocylindrales bacterium]
MPRQLVPPWLRRALEAAAVSAVVALGALAGAGLAAGGPFTLPPGLPGGLVLAPAVFALSVIPVAYPVAMAATRGDAVLGAMAALLIAADVTVVVAGGRVIMGPGGLELGSGLLVATLAAGPAIVGLLCGELLTPLGFGRRAGAIAAVTGALGAAAVLAALVMAG